jgi:predicted RNA binding protein YcfA (HicA-like mRNA interferase family)
MSKLGPIRWRDLVRRLRALGFEGPYQEGRHPFMVRGTFRLHIPNPHGDDIGAGLLARILREGRISREEWESAE